jgi:serine/threonine protein kinase
MPKEGKMSSEHSEVPRSSAQTSSHPADPFIGKTLGNCRIIKKISEGGSAFIYQAHNTHFNLERVVKILKPTLVYEQEFFTNFKQEAQLTARLDHPNILRVFDTGEYQGRFFIEEEYLAGLTLREYLFHKPKLPELEILSIALQIVKALRYAHQVKISTPDGGIINGILHRDIKPENIMINDRKEVKLMDFGAAKPLNLTSDTKQGMIVGTFHYMSPEQLAGKDVDIRSDFFALGIVMYELFAGRKPFEAENITELIEQIKQSKFTSLQKLRRSILPLTEELIDKLLSKKVQHRPSSAKEIEEDIQRCIHVYSTWGTGRKIKVPFSLRKAFPAFALLISLAALLLSGIAFWRSVSPAHLQSALQQESSSASLLEKGTAFEARKLWRDAVNIYETVPNVDQGGRANEYLEARIRLARISFKYFNQFTKARAILENLKLEFSDPAIDAYLGQIYYRLALYKEAMKRFELALGSKKGSVIPQTDEFKSEALYYQASAIDRQYTYVESDPALLLEALKAWNYFIEFSDCGKKTDTQFCKAALERKAALAKVEQKAK